MTEIAGKVAVVTGGASGIGRGIGQALAEKGVDVVIADIEHRKAEQAASDIAATGVRSLAVRCDVTDQAEVEAIAERAWAEFGHVDLVFNNAGVIRNGPLLDSSHQDLEWLFAVNVYGIWNGCVAFGRRFVAQGTPAHIVNTASEHGLGVPHLFAGIYTATKHAVIGLSDVLRRELPPFVGVSVLCPGVVDTALWDASRNRPTHLGGPTPGASRARALMERGLDPIDIGRRAVAGVEHGDFFIVTHSHARRYAEYRWREIADAFDHQAPFKPGDERYDVATLAAEITARNSKGDPKVNS